MLQLCFSSPLRYVLSALSQLETRVSSRGLIKRELQPANVYIISVLDAGLLTCNYKQS